MSQLFPHVPAKPPMLTSCPPLLVLRLCNDQLVHGTLVVHVILAQQGLYIFHLRTV